MLHAGGYEVNPLVCKVIAHGGLLGLLSYKFALVILVILICEYLASRRRPIGRWLARLSIVLTALPVTASIVQLLTIFSPIS